MSDLTALLQSVETIHALALADKDRHIEAHQENITLLIQAVMDIDNFKTKRNGPWQEIYKRVYALENVAEALTSLVEKSKSQGNEIQKARAALIALDATYEGEG